MFALRGLFLLACGALISGADVTRDVKIKTGTIRGKQMHTFTGRPYYAFQQVPYAQPPVGDLRFKEPVAPENWTDVMETLEANKICWQIGNDSDQESEDCLYLNVYTPVDPQKVTDLLPVYFWIHGGLFVSSNGNFESVPPQHFIDKNIVFVSVNFRQGVLGYLCTDDGTIPCNLGLKDQTFAMKWVQENIKSFGGDPDKVTIGGQSSGSGTVGYHIVSKYSQGLFIGAIMESGSPICSKMFQKNPTYFAMEMGKVINKSLDATVSSNTELLKVLRDADPKFFKYNSTLEIPEDKRNLVGNVDNTIWAPAMEYNETTGFIVSSMYENLKNGNFNLVPLLIGFTSEEEMRYLNSSSHMQMNLDDIKDAAKLFDNSNASIMINYYLNISDDNRLKAGEELKAVYTKTTFEKELGHFIKFISDAKYTTGTVRHAELQSKYTDVYLYQFAYRGVLNNQNYGYIEGAERVGHTEELKYLFGPNSYTDISGYPEEDVRTSYRMLRMWSNFIKYQNPTPKKEPLLQNVTWPKLKTVKIEYLNINETLEEKEGPKLYTLWRDIYDKYANEVQITY